MDAIPAECAVRSLGTGNQLVAVLIQALLSSYCKISEPKMWPKDYGSIVTKKGIPKLFLVLKYETADEFQT